MQSGLQTSLAGRTVKDHGVAVSLPDGGQLDAAWTMQAEEQTAGSATSNQNPLGKPKSSWLEVVLLAQGEVNELSKVFQIVKRRAALLHE